MSTSGPADTPSRQSAESLFNTGSRRREPHGFRAVGVLSVSEGGLGHREVGAVPPATVPVGEERGARGFVDMVGT